MECTNPSVARLSGATNQQQLLQQAASLVDEWYPLFTPEVSRRVDQLLAAADEQGLD